MPPVSWWWAGALIVAVAFALRIAVHVGRVPGGVDTWYYLAYADAVRRRPSFDVRLPQYLLQDERQSYPPLFPMLLALLPGGWLRRFYWVVSPAIDCAHLLLLYFVTFRITYSVPVAALAAATYAFTPQLVSETRSLSARPFGALLNSVAMVLTLKYVVSGGAWLWLMAAVASSAALYLSSAAMAAAFAFACLALSLVFVDGRYFAIAAAGLLLAVLVSGGHMLRVIRNYWYAVDYWRRNRRLFGAHPIRDSPIYGDLLARDRNVPQRPGFLGRSTLGQLVRLVGENPFLLALPLAPYGIVPWGPRLYVWALALAALSLIATVLPPLRAFGPGRSYIKAAIFPTAYTLAFGIGTPQGFSRPVGVVTLLALVASVMAIGFFYGYVRLRTTEQTASTPDALADAVHALRKRPSGGVFVLPFMYADYVCYQGEKPVLWGAHSGDLIRFEALAPVISRRLTELFQEHRVRYVLADTTYVPQEVLYSMAPLVRLGQFGSFELCEISLTG
jgi:hypothetical protein